MVKTRSVAVVVWLTLNWILRKELKIATDTASELTKCKPDILATACPLCKKTFSNVTETKVADIAEIVAGEISEIQKRKAEFQF